MARNFLFTSESVSEGHPDKVADQISDAVLDALLAQDPKSRVACETMVNTGMVVLAGEITTNAVVDYQAIVRKTIKEIGYNHSEMGFDYNSCAVLVALDEQSKDIAQGVNEGEGLDMNQGFNFVIRNNARTIGINHDGYRLSNTNRVGDLHLTLGRQAPCHNILGHITRRVRRRAIDLGRVFA